MTTTYQTGDTVRLSAVFKNFAGDLADCDGLPTIKIYDVNKTDITPVGATVTRDSLGTYHYDYLLPSTEGGYYYEFSGNSEGTVELRRGLMIVTFV